jgi:hypothetical protein
MLNTVFACLLTAAATAAVTVGVTFRALADLHPVSPPPAEPEPVYLAAGTDLTDVHEVRLAIPEGGSTKAVTLKVARMTVGDGEPHYRMTPGDSPWTVTLWRAGQQHIVFVAESREP